VPLVEQELLTLPEHLNSHTVVNGVHVAQCLVFCVVSWFSCFLGSCNPLWRKPWWEPQALEYRINWEIYTTYAGAAGMLLHINGKFTKELCTPLGHLMSPTAFSEVSITWSLVLCKMFHRSLFVLLYFFSWLLCCMLFSDIRILITPLVSSNSSQTS
jgi:hypothetical protein